ncbi:DUF58 domain-containing protein [Treponema putidum]|uniref:DUF58 domain-containing protein n=2 Tax=Treponema putidum TaxID=221027 RepID=A0AAE9MTE1_9SPIR|nr:DUF58 domain-containing protein [Treponema putidum]TWI78678.1 uncharacterized protein DUF58 [Treponema putidum]UTY29431.1 DUF58 domain-containing protein [Treponema putidum]UTY31924.1 DUF58 domain-containing protein [Treponema putidum]UTY34289.1 DUF58 domain-containing protein [Treponema putidum]
MKVFKLTVPGIIYILFSILLLTGAGIRGELFAVVCGVCLCLYFVLSLVCLIISIFLCEKTNYLIKLKNEKISILPVGNRIGKNLFPIILPGVIIFYIFEFSSDLNDKKSRRLRFNIKLKREQTFFSIPKEERGRFFLEREYIELSDLAGFFSFRLLKKEKSIPQVFIYPVLSEIKTFSFPAILNETSDHTINLRRTDELYDTRPYFPGDDIRKINWKLYAHTQELSIKQGDYIPPPRSFFTVYVETPVVSRDFEFYKKKFDEFINLISSIAFYLHQNGISFKILFYDNEKNSYETELVYVDETDAEETIKRIFSIPQLKILNKKSEYEPKLKKNFFIDDENKKNYLLYFFMPVQSGNKIFEKFFRNFSDYKNECAFYTGLETIIYKPKNILHSFLFYTFSQKKYRLLSKQMNENIETIKYALRNGGFYAYSI